MGFSGDTMGNSPVFWATNQGLWQGWTSFTVQTTCFWECGGISLFTTIINILIIILF